MKNINKMIKVMLFVCLILFSTGGTINVCAEEELDYSEMTEGVDYYQESNIYTFEADRSIDQLNSRANGFSIENFKNAGARTDFNIVASNNVINAGSTTTYTVSSTLATTVEGTASITAAEVNVKAGMSTTGSVTISRSFSFGCPVDINGQQISKCNVIYYPRYNKYTFDVHFLGIKTGSGSAYVFVGYEELINYIYK